MIKTITLRNFQIHKYKKFDFDKGFNVILGENDRGKSSIIRALHWIIYNKPSGNWMCKIDDDGELLTTSVKIVSSNGDVVIRKKGPEVNRYIVNGDAFNNFGFDVPKSVKDILGIDFLNLNGINVSPNVSMDYDLPFMIFEKNTTKAALINNLTGIDLVEKAKKSFNRDILNNSKMISFYKTELDKNEKELKTLPYIADIKEDCLDIEIKFIEYESENERLSNLKIFENSLNRLNKDLNSINHKEDILSSMHRVDMILKEYKKDKDTVLKLSDFKTNLNFYEKSCDDCVLSVDLDIVKAKLKDNQFMEEKIADLAQIKKDLDNYLEIIKKYDNILKGIKKEYNKLKGKACPLCGKKYD